MVSEGRYGLQADVADRRHNSKQDKHEPPLFLVYAGIPGNASRIEEELILVSEGLGNALDDFDLIVAPLEHAVVDRRLAVTQDPLEVAFQEGHELLQRGDPAAHGPPPLRLPEAERRRWGPVVPQALQVLPEHVDRVERPMCLQQVPQAHALSGRRERVPFPQQQAACALDHTPPITDGPGPRRPGQAVRFVHADPIHHLAAEDSHDVEVVVHQLDLRTVGPDLAAVRLPHVDRRQFQRRTARGAHRREATAHCSRISPPSDPDHAFALEVQHHHCVGVPSMQGELVDGDPPDPVQMILRRRQPGPKRPAIDLLDCASHTTPNHAAICLMGSTCGNCAILSTSRVVVR